VAAPREGSRASEKGRRKEKKTEMKEGRKGKGLQGHFVNKNSVK
jgi:hypothetical protein